LGPNEEGVMAARPVELLVNIDVPDLEHAIRFYCEGLGLRLRRKLFAASVAELEGAACPVFLLHKPAGSPIGPAAREARDYARHWTAVHLDFVVPALAPALERAVRAGARQEGAIQTFDWGCQALLSDPYGNGFCLVEWRDGGYRAVVSP
jgi:predicted enzyme related to lactoylglutathione lyase